MRFEETHEVKSLGHLGTDADNRSNLVSLADVGRWLMHGPNGYPYYPAVAKLLDELEANPAAQLYKCFTGTWAELIDEGVCVNDGWFQFDAPDDTPTHGRRAVLYMLRVAWLPLVIGPNLIDPREEFPVLPGFAWAMTRKDAEVIFRFGIEESDHAPQQPHHLELVPSAKAVHLAKDKWKDDKKRWTPEAKAEMRRLRAEGLLEKDIGKLFGVSYTVIGQQIDTLNPRPTVASWMPTTKGK